MARTKGVSLDWLVLGVGEMQANAPGQIRDAPEASYQGASDVAARITRFVSMWDGSRTREEMIWLEQHLKRTVPEYGEWLDQQGEDAPTGPP
jgi:hypothetical protein